MRFAHPVIQERARVAEQARDARVRLTEGSPTVALHQFMTDRLRLIDSDLDAVDWDAYRDDDGTWQVTGAWRAGDKSGTTRWSFDLPSRTVTPSTPRRWTSPRAPAWSASSPTCPAGLPSRPREPPGHRCCARSAGPGRRRPGATTPSPPTSSQMTSSLMAHRATSDVRDVHPADGRPRATGRSTRSSTRSPSTTPWSWAAAATSPSATKTPRARIPAWEDIVFGVRRHR